jgi:hypothetical protein
MSMAPSLASIPVTGGGSIIVADGHARRHESMGQLPNLRIRPAKAAFGRDRLPTPGQARVHG